MCQLLESISLREGAIERLHYHQQRMDKACANLFNKRAPYIGNILQEIPLPSTGHHKIRVLYSENQIATEIVSWKMPVINSLRVVFSDQISYGYKYSDRSVIDSLFEQRGHCDDILIIKNGQVSDTSYCNIILFDGRKWVTPLQPLLKGTVRQYLLDQSLLTEDDISFTDLYRYKKVKLINAMMGFDGPEIPLENITV